ncbi:EcoKI restriction-modification system protein HsdS [Moraxella lacunata]|uniref:EcoKI restriction-modification system protein HsdS n=1 Tax=Moraxella lacunata TaxID=477 RepID=A0A378T8J2_MORLA|nr:restriction endonuclease subunit S [Moraxella lacunata]STZ56467.1 EcoKI restriction-modification system protein HsdS [Moraxella lacunata]
MSERKVPKLRFAGFTDDWKQRKLGEVVFQIKSYSLSRNVETNKDTGFKYVHYGDIHRNIAKLLSSENNLPSIQKGNYEFLQKGDLVIADASEDYEGIGNSCLIDCFLSRNIVSGLHTIALRPTEVNSLFLYYLLHTDIFSQYGKVIATGTKVFGITAKNLLNFEFNLPSETEQQAIGEFFRQLDDTIAFHQREWEKYKNLKNSYLEKMFPQENENKPQLRFPNFTDAWKQRKLGEVVEFFSGLTYSPKNITDNSGVLVLRSSNIQNDFLYLDDNVYVKQECANSENVQLGDIIVVVRNGSKNLIGKHAIIMKNMEKTVIGAFMTGIRYKHYWFLNALLNTETFKYEIEKNLGATINQITMGMFKEMKFYFPSETEQQAIGEFFRQLDDTIAFHQRELEKYKNLKNGYLKQMFV